MALLAPPGMACRCRPGPPRAGCPAIRTRAAPAAPCCAAAGQGDAGPRVSPDRIAPAAPGAKTIRKSFPADPVGRGRAAWWGPCCWPGLAAGFDKLHKARQRREDPAGGQEFYARGTGYRRENVSPSPYSPPNFPDSAKRRSRAAAWCGVRQNAKWMDLGGL